MSYRDEGTSHLEVLSRHGETFDLQGAAANRISVLTVTSMMMDRSAWGRRDGGNTYLLYIPHRTAPHLIRADAYPLSNCEPLREP